MRKLSETEKKFVEELLSNDKKISCNDVNN